MNDDLLEILANLYSDEASRRTLAIHAGVPYDTIDISGAAHPALSTLLRHAKHTRSYEKLSEEIRNNHPGHERLRELLDRYVEATSPDRQESPIIPREDGAEQVQLDVVSLTKLIAATTEVVIQNFENLPGERITELVSEDDASDGTVGFFDQETAVNQVLKLIKADGQKIISVVGSAGVGKSTVLRAVAKSLAAKCLTDIELSDQKDVELEFPIPVVINLGRVAGEFKTLTSLVFDWWFKYASDEYQSIQEEKASAHFNKLDLNDIKKLGESKRVVLILDALDEFLWRYREYEDQDVYRWIEQLLDKDGKLGVFSSVVLARRSQDTLYPVPGIDSVRIEIGCLSRQGARKFLPSDSWLPILDKAPDDVRSILFTPLILKQLRATDHSLRNMIVRGAPHLTNRSLRSSEEKLEKYTSSTDESFWPSFGEEDTASNWDSSSLLEFAFYCNLFDGSDRRIDERVIADSLLSSAIVALSKSSTTSELMEEDVLRSAEQLHLLDQSTFIFHYKLLIASGVLHQRIGASGRVVEFSHSVWYYLSLSRGVAELVKESKFKDLAGKAFNEAVWVNTGYFLSILCNQEKFEFNSQSFESAYFTGDQFAYGVLGALLAYSPVPLAKSGLESIGKNIGSMSVLAGHTLLSGFSGRFFERFPGDPSIYALKDSIGDWSKTILESDDYPQFSKSLAYCILCELEHEAEQIPMSAVFDSSTHFDTKTAFSEAYLFSLGNLDRHAPSAMKIKRQMERVRLGAILRSIASPARLIGGVHYALLVASCFKNDDCQLGNSRPQLAYWLSNALEIRKRIAENLSPKTAARLGAILDFLVALDLDD